MEAVDDTENKNKAGLAEKRRQVRACPHMQFATMLSSVLVRLYYIVTISSILSDDNDGKGYGFN